MELEKYHASGNDFLISEELSLLEDKEKIIQLCNRHTGIGADGLILYDKQENRMHIINKDGSMAAMCGNGLRCLTHYLYHHQKLPEIIYSDADIHPVKVIQTNPFHTEIYIGTPEYTWDSVGCSKELDIPWNYEGYLFYPCHCSTNHLVCFVDSLQPEDIEDLGKKIMRHPYFPDGININFVRVSSSLFIQTYERGAGLTLSCGTGSCASFALAYQKYNVPQQIIVENPYGNLSLSITEENKLYLTGESVRVFHLCL